jgi:hypothetical protein
MHLAPDHLETLCRQLVQRGHFVTAAEMCPATVIVGFNFMPRAVPAWLKAFEVTHRDATPDGVEAAMEKWKAGVRRDLERGEVSDTVRLMIAEHGPGAVQDAMRGKLRV